MFLSCCRFRRRKQSPPTSPESHELRRAGSYDSVGVMQDMQGLRRCGSLHSQSIDLDNPDFVFECCGMDRSGNLSIHGVKHALRSQGLAPEDNTLRQYLQEGDVIDVAAFKHLLRALQDCPPDTMRCHAEVPHALRGMRLDQLEHIEHTFISTGWLEHQCSTFNMLHQAEISAGTAFAKGDSLYSIDEYIVRPLTQPGGSIPREFSHSLGDHIAEVRRPCSYSELLHPSGCFVQVFVSHFWGHPFSKSLRAMKAWSTERCRDVGVAPEHITFWICLFAINQHKPAEEVGKSPKDGPFNAALAHARWGAVMIIDRQALPFKRLWCIFEVHRITELGLAFELITEEGALNTMLGNTPEGPPHRAALECLTSIGDALLAVSACGATASNLEDKLRICHSVCSNFIKNVAAGALPTPELYDHPYAFTDFDQRIQGLLAQTLLEVSLSREDWNGAFKWCVAGAAFGSKELLLFEEKNIDLTAEVSEAKIRTTLLTSAAGINNLEAVQWLIDRRADLAHRGPSEHGDAMNAATAFGQSEMVQLLLDRHACIESRETLLQTTPLGVATAHNHFRVVGVLLEHGADVEARNALNGSVCEMLHTPLHGAVMFNSAQSVQLLLSHRVELEAQEPLLGHRPLHISAMGGFPGVMELILRHCAQVNARSLPLSAERPPHVHQFARYPTSEKVLFGAFPGGRTPLMIAACCGHLDACQLLTRYGADIELRDECGQTALDLVSKYRDDCRAGDVTIDAIVRYLGGRSIPI